MGRVGAILSIMAALSGSAPVSPPDEDGLVVRIIRFYRPELNQTRVWAFLQIPQAFLTQPAAGERSYEALVKVLDSTGLELYRESWREQPRAGSYRGAYVLEVLDFLAAPGGYRLVINIRDLGSGKQAQRITDLHTFAENPGASDLVLSPAMRGDADGPERLGELHHGTLRFVPMADPRFGVLPGEAYFLLEMYGRGGDGEPGMLTASVVDSTGRTRVETPPRPFRLQPLGGIVSGKLSLAGLPPGRYAMRIGARVRGQLLERTSEFRIHEGTVPVPEVSLRP